MQIRSTSGIRLVVLLVIIIGIGVSLTVLAVSARGWLAASRSSGKHTTTPAAGNLSPAVIQTSKTDSQVEVELITITPSGFEPAVIKRPKGDFILSITNRSEQPDLTISISKFQGNRQGDKIKDTSLPKGRSNGFDRHNLPPGDYVLTEAKHPDWSCRITITP